MSRPWTLTLAAGPVVPGVTATQAATAWLLGEEPTPTPQPRDLTDAEADAFFAPASDGQGAARRRAAMRARRPAGGDEIHAALFADTHADTPDDAQELGW